MAPTGKLSFSGVLFSVQPRIRLMRSFDQRYHGYFGYVLGIEGLLGEASAQAFSVAVGKAAHAKLQFRVGDRVKGFCEVVAVPETEAAGYYKASGLEILARAPAPASSSPPFHDLAPALEEYRARGHVRLAPDAYEFACKGCVWGCRMPVEMIIDQWDPSNKRHRFETFCYGPDGCALYKAGSKRVVPGRKGMKHTETIEDRETRRGESRDDAE